MSFISIQQWDIYTNAPSGQQALISIDSIRYVQQVGEHSSICVGVKEWVSAALPFAKLCELIQRAGGTIEVV